MPGGLSDYSKNELLDHLFNAAYSAAATVYLALCTADPTDAGTGASMNESAGSANGYSRKAISFAAASSRKVVQSGAVSFDAATGSWGTLTHWAIVDSATIGAGNMLAHGEFSSSFTPVSGNTPSIADAEVEVEIQATAAGAGFSDYTVHKWLDLMFRNQAFSSTAGNTFVALLNAVADDQDVATTDLTEITGTDYARVEVNPNGGASPTWDLAASGALDNTHQIDIGPPGADDWDQVVAMAIVDAVSGLANVLAYDNANIVDQTPTSADTVQFAAGALDVSLD